MADYFITEVSHGTPSGVYCRQTLTMGTIETSEDEHEAVRSYK